MGDKDLAKNSRKTGSEGLSVRQNTLWGILSLSAAYCLAGSSVVAARFLSDSLSPFGLTFMSLVAAIWISLLFSGKKLIQTMRTLGFRQYCILALQAILGILMFRVFLNFALRFTAVSEIGIVTGTSPVVTAVLARTILKEPVSLKGKTAIAISVAGMLLLEKKSTASGGKMPLLGLALAFAAVLCESLFNILARKLVTEKLPPTVHAGIVSMIAAVLCIGPALMEGSLSAVYTVSASGWLALLWYGGAVTVGAYSLMFYGAGICSGHTIAACTGVMPLTSVLLSIAFLGESVELRQWAGFGCVVTAVFLLIKKES